MRSGSGADLLPQARRLVVVGVDREPQALDRQPVHRRHQVPGEADGVGLEVVAEREVAQHLEEGVMAGGVADVVEVVVLAAGAHALLRRGRARVVALLAAEEHVLELVHAGVGEQQGGVPGRDQRRRRHHAVTALGKEIEKRLTDLTARPLRLRRHRHPLPGRSRARGRPPPLRTHARADTVSPSGAPAEASGIPGTCEPRGRARALSASPSSPSSIPASASAAASRLDAATEQHRRDRAPASPFLELVARNRAGQLGVVEQPGRRQPGDLRADCAGAEPLALEALRDLPARQRPPSQHAQRSGVDVSRHGERQWFVVRGSWFEYTESTRT